MFKKLLFFLFIGIAPLCNGQEYSKTINMEGLHTTYVSSSWCGNLALSTKMGHQSENGTCIYVKETSPMSFDNCGPFYLNAYLLEQNAGPGFTCAATHVHSLATGQDAQDEYLLIVDEHGHYISTRKPTGQIALK